MSAWALLLRRARNLPGVAFGHLNERLFNASKYIELASDLLTWTKHRLTTAAMARYVLQVIGLNASAQLRILYTRGPLVKSHVGVGRLSCT